MKNLKRILLFSVFTVTSYSFAGVKVIGNGGVAIVCRNLISNRIVDATLLDLFEAENMGRTIKRSSKSLDDQIAEKLTKLDSLPGIKIETQRQIKLIRQETNFIPNFKVGMPLTDDTFPRLRKKGCNYEQVGTYFEDNAPSLEAKGVLQVDKEIYESLSTTDKAAFWFHESLYKLDRRLNSAKTSINARDLTGILFSEELLVSGFEKTFGYFNYLENVIWLDPSEKLELRFISTVPIDSQCYITTLVGPVFVESKPYSEVVVLNPGWSADNEANINGKRYIPRSKCWFVNKPEGDITFELSQKGKKVVTLKMSEFRTENEGASLYESQTNTVIHSDGRTTQDLVWRFQ